MLLYIALACLAVSACVLLVAAKGRLTLQCACRRQSWLTVRDNCLLSASTEHTDACTPQASVPPGSGS